ncbi:MAG: rRNA maturation RNase YbeY, partial [Candidatus Gastranaerophilales bacterium]|nr:rRNA maturation RNase YbeY [Candidatus Gastranaerophilales bacterium]
MSKTNIFIENAYENFNIDEVEVQKNVSSMAEYILNNKEITSKSFINNYKYDTLTFDIVLTNNEEIHRINKEYRNKDVPTDVITFAIFADSEENERYIIDGDIVLGEIIVSLDKIKEQSIENN